MTQNGVASVRCWIIGITSSSVFDVLEVNGHGLTTSDLISTIGDLASPMEAANAFDYQLIIHGNGQTVIVISGRLPVSKDALKVGLIEQWATSVSAVKYKHPQVADG